MARWVIYKVRNLKSGRVYIGCSTNVSKRIREHQGERPHILAGGFDVQELASAQNREDASYLEAYFVSLFDSTDQTKGYNLQTGGFFGFGVSTAVIEKMRESHLGLNHTSQSKRKISEGQRGLRRGQEFREKMSLIRKNKPIYVNPRERDDFQEHMKLMSSKRVGVASWNKGKKMDEKYRERCRQAWIKRRSSLAP